MAVIADNKGKKDWKGNGRDITIIATYCFESNIQSGIKKDKAKPFGLFEKSLA